MSLTQEQIEQALKSSEVKAAIAAAVDDAVKGLKNKNSELLGDMKDLKTKLKEIEDEKEEIERKVADKSGDVNAIKEQLKKEFEKKEKQYNETISKLTGQLNIEVIEKGLSQSLVKAKIAPEHMDAVTALIKTVYKGEVGDNDGKPFAKFDGKAVDEFVTGWVQTDVGKRYVLADNNSGGGSNGATGNGKANSDSKKTITRSEFEALPMFDRAKKITDGFVVVD